MRPAKTGTELGRRLRKWRKDGGLKQSDVAERLTRLRGWRVYPHQISIWECHGQIGGASKQLIEALLDSTPAPENEG